MWSVMFVKARDAGFIAMIRLSTMYRMMVASSTYSAARLLRSRAFVKLCIAGSCGYWFNYLGPITHPVLRYLSFSQIKIIECKR